MRASFRSYDGHAKLVVAFDIGTTESAISYAMLEPHQVPVILSVARFPAQGIARSDAKIPSLLYYDKAGIVRAAGAEALVEDVIQAALSEGWTKAEWWKLHFCPNHLSDGGLPPLPPGKSAVDVLADFIKYLFACFKTYVQECHPGFSWLSHSTEYTLTYPTGWGEVENLYRLAVDRAGLVPRTPGDQICVHMLSEGEAELHFCVWHYLSGEKDKQTTPQGVVVIDAGGGTVDMSMFTMVSHQWKQTVSAECRLQGSVFVTRRAGILLQRKLEGWERSSLEDIAQFTREFDRTTKLIIENDHEPAYVKVAGRRTKSSIHCILSGQLKLLGEEATNLFNESIRATIDAFEKQEKSTTIPITTAFLVGGLSNNDWFWSRLQLYFSAKNISVYRPSNRLIKGVAIGAVLSQLSKVIPAVAAHNSENRPTVTTINSTDLEPRAVQPRCPSCESVSVGARNLVVFIDGTSNKPGSNQKTNVVKLLNALSNEDFECKQRTFYLKEINERYVHRLPLPSRVAKKTYSGLDMECLRNAEENVKDAYGWLSKTYQRGDQIYLFGFSRGAYQVRALAAMVHEVGLVREKSEELVEHAYRRYLSIDPKNPKSKESTIAFKRESCWPDTRIHFVGVWDTPSSLGLIKNDVHITSVTNVCHFRHALALDESRVKFVPEYFLEVNARGSNVQSPQYGTSDVKEVWFSGCHSDVGGASKSYAETGPTPVDKCLYPVPAGNVPLLWMSQEAATHGLLFKPKEPAWYLDSEDIDLCKEDTRNFLWKVLDLIPIRHQISFSGAGRHKWRWHQTRPLIAGQQIYSPVLSDEGKDHKPSTDIRADPTNRSSN